MAHAVATVVLSASKDCRSSNLAVFSSIFHFFVAKESVARAAGSRLERLLPDDLENLWVVQVLYILQ